MVTSYVPFLNMFSTQCPIFYIGYIFFFNLLSMKRLLIQHHCFRQAVLEDSTFWKILPCLLFIPSLMFFPQLLQVSQFLPHLPKTYSILIISIVHVVNMSKISIIFPSFLFYPLFLRSLASSYHQTLFSNWGQRTLLGHTGEDGEGARKKRQRCGDSASHIYR